MKESIKKESEDERIRKELKEAFEAYDIESSWNGIPIRSIFAWLEKQKEKATIPDELVKLYKEFGKKVSKGEVEFINAINGYSEKQKEQKPETVPTPAIPNPSMTEVPDHDLVKELRRRGYDVTCKKTIEL